ncbi:MAG TPA: glycosyltransferase [Blastocatellia bacterium]|nr:glycosyltransferase [Blastocatellia bacterium]
MLEQRGAAAGALSKKGVAVKFLVFSDDWGEHPSSCQHLFQVLTHDHPTIWVNTVGLRVPQFTLNDTVKGARKLSAMLGLRPPHKPNGQNGHAPFVSVPLMTPFHRPQWLADWNRRSLLKHVSSQLQKHDFQDFTLITTTPSVSDVIAELKAPKVIYYCVDDFSEWPGMEKKLILGLEQKLLQHVHTVICSSQPLYEKFHDKYPTHLLRHGVDVKLFAETPAQEHPCLRHIPKPRVGYYGNFDKRNNQELIRALAQAMPHVSFVFTGPIQDNVSALRKLPNVYFTGAVAYEELPSVIKGWEACLLPYYFNTLTVNINPLKLKEYLASGKPVIATPLPDVCDLSEYLRALDEQNIAGWCAAIDDAISGRWVPDRTTVNQMLAGESWERKADIFLRICQVAGVLLNLRLVGI